MPDSFLRVSTALAAADFCAAVTFLGVDSLSNMSVSAISVASATVGGWVVTVVPLPGDSGGVSDDDASVCPDEDAEPDDKAVVGDVVGAGDVAPIDAGVETLCTRGEGAVNPPGPCENVIGGNGAGRIGSGPVW